jgi:hypothetical protein
MGSEIMRIKKIFSSFLCIVIVFVCVPFSVSAVDSVPTADYVDDEVVFEFSESGCETKSSYVSTEEYFTSELPDLGILSLKAISTYEKTDSNDSKPVVYVAKISGDVLDTCKKLEKISGVNYAEPNYQYGTDSFTSPAEITKTSGVYSTYEKWYFEDMMNIPAAWQKYENTGANVIVAVIDNGFNLSAIDAPVNFWSDANGNHGWNVHSNTNNIAPIFKSDGTNLGDTGHGSNVAGIIGMAANGLNGVGVAYSAQLMLIQAAQYVNDTSNTTFAAADIAAAVNYAVSNGAKIINMSICSLAYANVIKTAVDSAYNSGVAIIAAAGNGYYDSTKSTNYPYSTEQTLLYPAAATNVLGVMAIDKTDSTQLALFSNYDPSGNYYEIAAPGVQILGCNPGSTGMSLFDGTSQACPLVAGCTAMYLSLYPTTTVDQLYTAIKNSSTHTVTSNKTAVTDKTYTFKSLNALELLEYGEIKPEINANLSTTVTLDNTRGYIYGLSENYTDITSYVTVTSGTGTMVLTPTSMGNGTGSVLNIYKLDGALYKTYTVIIFGDVNGDCKANGCDAVITSFIIDSPTVFTDYQKFAADVDFNDSVTTADYNIIANYAIGLDSVFQSR